MVLYMLVLIITNKTLYYITIRSYIFMLQCLAHLSKLNLGFQRNRRRWDFLFRQNIEVFAQDREKWVVNCRDILSEELKVEYWRYTDIG
jgi:hypothetical protein